MALSGALIVVALAATIFSTIAMATEFIVGDEKGWTVGFDYQAWAANKVFRVGDKLLFQYPAGKSSVFKVNGTDFKNCAVPAGSQGLTSGWDTIELASPGRRWYIDGVNNHCQLGQKLAITVLPSETHPPSASWPWTSPVYPPEGQASPEKRAPSPPVASPWWGTSPSPNSPVSSPVEEALPITLAPSPSVASPWWSTSPSPSPAQHFSRWLPRKLSKRFQY